MSAAKEHPVTCPCCHSTQLSPDIWVEDNGNERPAVECNDCGTQGYLDVWVKRSALAGPLKSLMIQLLWGLNCTTGSVNLGLPRVSANNIANALAELDPDTAAETDMLVRQYQNGEAA